MAAQHGLLPEWLDRVVAVVERQAHLGGTLGRFGIKVGLAGRLLPRMPGGGGPAAGLTIAFTSLVWFAVRRHGKWLAWRPLVFRGVISYPLYLVHVVLGFAVIRWGVAHGWSTIEGVVAAGLVSLTMATLLHYFVEAPGGRWVRTALSRRQPPANPALPASRPVAF